MGAPIGSREKALGLNLETTNGTFAAPAAPLNAVILEADGGPSELLPEQVTPALNLTGTRPRVVGMEMATLSFRWAIASADDFLSVLLPALGYLSDGGAPATFEPMADTSAIKTLSAKLWEGGKVKQFTGMAPTSFSLSPERPGGRVIADVELAGVWNGNVDEATPSATHSSRNFYQAKGVTLNVGGAWAGGKVSNFDLNFNPAAESREDIVAASGILSDIITDRLPQLTIDPEKTLVATADELGLLLAGTTASGSLALSDQAGSATTLTISFGELQRISAEPGVRGQKQIETLTFECHQSTNADGNSGVGDDVTFNEA